jgi:O-antigen ligase
MDSSVRIQRLPIYTAVLATIVVIPSLMDPINLPKLWILCLGAGLSLAIFSRQAFSLFRSSGKVLLFLSFLFVAGLSISSLASPQGFFRTLIGVWGRNNGTLNYLALVIIFLCLSSTKSADPSKYLIKALTLLGISGALYGWMQNVGADLIAWENPGNQIILTLGNSNFASAFLGLTSIATLAFLLQPKTHTWIRLGLVISFITQIFLTKQSDALQGLLILILGSTILIGFYITFSIQSKVKRFAILWWGIMFTTGVIGVIGLFGNGPLASFLNPNLFSLKDRFYHWVAGVNMLRDNLIFGVGIDSFGDYYRQYRVLEGVQLRATAMSGTNNAHNVLVQIGATGGLVLLLPYLAIIVFTGCRAFVALRKSEDKLLVSGIFSIWIAFQVQSLVSIDQIGLTIWGWASAGCLVSLSFIKPEERNSKKTSKAIVHRLHSRPKLKVDSLLILIGILPAFLMIPTIQNELILKNRLIAMASSETLESLRSNGTEVVRAASKSREPELRLKAMDYLLKAELNQDALALSIRNTIEFPNSFDSWNATAEIYEQLGQKKKAIRYRERSVELDPLNDAIVEKLIQDQKD